MGLEFRRDYEREMTLKEYIEFKITMLANDFNFRLTDYERTELRGCKTKYEVDRVAHDLFKKYL